MLLSALCTFIVLKGGSETSGALLISTRSYSSVLDMLLSHCVFMCLHSCFVHTGLQSSSSLRNSRQALAQLPGSTVCSKACRGPFVSWSTSCSQTSQSSLCSVSLCEWTERLLLFTDLNRPRPFPSEIAKQLIETLESGLILWSEREWRDECFLFGL